MAVLDEIDRLDLIKNANDVGEMLRSELAARQDRYAVIGDVRGCGLFLGVEMVKSDEKKSPDSKITITIVNLLKDKGFLTSNDGSYGNVLKIRPPLVFSSDDAANFLIAFDEVMEGICG